MITFFLLGYIIDEDRSNEYRSTDRYTHEKNEMHDIGLEDEFVQLTEQSRRQSKQGSERT